MFSVWLYPSILANQINELHQLLSFSATQVVCFKVPPQHFNQVEVQIRLGLCNNLIIFFVFILRLAIFFPDLWCPCVCKTSKNYWFSTTIWELELVFVQIDWIWISPNMMLCIMAHFSYVLIEKEMFLNINSITCFSISVEKLLRQHHRL